MPETLDILEELRAWHRIVAGSAPLFPDTGTDSQILELAIREIERLRAENARLREGATAFHDVDQTNSLRTDDVG